MSSNDSSLIRIPNASSYERDSEVSLTVEVTSAKGLPLVRYRHMTRRKYYVLVKVDENVAAAQRTRGMEGVEPVWKQTFNFNARLNSKLTFEIFAVRTLRLDKLIGSFSDTVTSFSSTETSFERELTPLAEATIRFSAKISEADPQEVLHQLLETTHVDIGLLTTPIPDSDAASVVDTAQSGVGALNDWSPLLDKLQIFCKIMDGVAEVHPYATMAWTILSAAYKVFKQQLDRDGKIKSLYDSMNALYMLVYDLQKNLDNNQIKIQEDVIIRIARQTAECCYFIRSYATDPGFVKRMAKNTFSNVDQRIQSYCSAFEALRQAFFDKIQVETRIVVTRVLNEAHDITIKLNFNDLPYAGGAALWIHNMESPGNLDTPAEYLSAKMCLPGTRIDVLQEIQNWVNYEGSDAKRVLLLTGAAGTGKSAIAHTIAYRFAALDRLGASFSFDRNQKERTPDKLFPTIARDLADFDSVFGQALFSAIKQNKALRTTLQLNVQFTNFILNPTKDLKLIGPLLIVFDAIDECGDATDISRRELISLLARRVRELPDNFRILITSRPEYDITSQLHDEHIHLVSMHNISPTSNTDDIRLYVRCRLLESPPVPLDGIDEACCNNLALSSQGLFQWAFVVCDQIISAELYGPGITAHERYEELIQSTHGKSQADVLDSLYTNILSQLFKGKAAHLVRFKAVMKLVLAPFEPPTLDIINEMLRHSGDTFNARTIVLYLAALLSGVTFSDEPIGPLHTSFRDFLADEDRSGVYYVESTTGHYHLALASLRIMEVGLKFNICGLESSYQLNKNIRRIHGIEQLIPAHLSYASRFWSRHLELSAPDRLDDVYLALLKRFLCEKLLFWFETLSLLDAVSVASPALSSLARQIPTSMLSPDISIADFARDARKFVETFSVAVSESAPHIYLSALAFTPESSIVKKLYASTSPRMLKVRDPYEHWPAAQGVINCQMKVKSVSVSPNGLYVASVGYTGSTDRIRIWDMNTGRPVYRAFLEQPKSWVWMVAFSPDGSHLCTCSCDQTVQIWNWETGKVVDHPVPKERINTIAFNPKQASQVVCGSFSGMIYAWDIADDKLSIQWRHNDLPLWTYGSRIMSVAWSFDGTLIVSGGEDATARLWNASTGEPVGRPLMGHTNVVACVAFSPNGQWLASGSYDNSVRLWDISTSPVSEAASAQIPSVIHEAAVRSIVFAPDNSSLALCAETLVFLWDLSQPEIPRLTTFSGHAKNVHSVTYSPDGAHVVSGSNDGTIRMWDVEASAPTRTFEKHAGAIWSIAFSPDGLYIVTGSQDKTARFWELYTGTHSTLETQNLSRIISVAISPDSRVIATASLDSVIQLHDPKTLKPLFPPLRGHDRFGNTVVFWKDYFITCCSRKILLWNAATAELAQHQLASPNKSHSYEMLVVSRDAPYVAAGCAQELWVWNIETGELIHRLSPGGTRPDFKLSLAISTDGRRMLSRASGVTRLWNVKTGESETIGVPQLSEWVGAVALSPDNVHFAFSDRYGTIWIWDIEAKGTPLSIDCNIGAITALAYSSDGLRLASGSEDGKVQIWDVVQQTDDKAVLFSREPSHALSEVQLISPNASLKPTEDVKLRNDGWVVVEGVDEDRLLFWVPVEQRDTLILPARKTVLGGEPSELDLANFSHGSNWTQCYSP